jgi:hypothetical protein
MRTLAPLGLLLVCAAGCGAKPPTAELVSWRVAKEALPISQGTTTPKGENVFVVVRVRGTGTGLYRQSDTDKDMYRLTPGDFTLTAPGGPPVKAILQRNTAFKEFAENSYRDKPGKEEEVEVVFPVESKMAERADMVVRYHDLPELKLDAAKKGK